MIHEIEPHKFNNQFKNDFCLSDDSLIFVFGGENEQNKNQRSNTRRSQTKDHFSVSARHFISGFH